METRFQKVPASSGLGHRARFLDRRKMVWGFGWQTPSRKGVERKSELWLHLYSCAPWPMPGGPCSSNCRVVMRTYWRASPMVEEEVIVGFIQQDRCRRVMRLQLPQPYGRLGLHILAYWFFFASRSGSFKDFGSFRSSCKQVDHGPGGHPHILDWRTLQLLPASGPGSNASQGASLRYHTYGLRGGLTAVVAKRPAGRHLDAAGKRARAVEHLG